MANNDKGFEMEKAATMPAGFAYRIVDWAGRYEVNSGGKPAAVSITADKLKKLPLSYVRWTVNGHKLGAGYRKMMETATTLGPGMDLAVFGLFGKLMELAADQPAGLRGWILDNQGEPINAEKIKYIIFANDIDVVKRGLDVLINPDVAWLELAEFPAASGEFSQTPPVLADISQTPPVLADISQTPPNPSTVKSTAAESGGDRRLLQDETETETKERLKQKQNNDQNPHLNSLDSRVSVSMLRVAEILGISSSNASDLTTLRDIFDQIKEQVESSRFNDEVFSKIENKASMCKGRRRGIAMFVAAAKEQFGYVPVNRRILEKRQ